MRPLFFRKTEVARARLGGEWGYMHVPDYHNNVELLGYLRDCSYSVLNSFGSNSYSVCIAKCPLLEVSP